MVRVGGLRIVHKWFVVRDVVSGVYDRIVASQPRVMLAAYGASLGVHTGWREATLEPSPSDALCVEKIADVFAGHCDLVHGLKLGIRCDAVIKQGPRISDHGSRRCAIRDVTACRSRLSVWAERCKCTRVGIPSDQVEGTGGGRPKGRAPGVVAHRKVLRVIPHGRNGVAVVVTHGACRTQHGVVAAQLFDEFIHQPAVRCRLLIAVVVVFVASYRHARWDAKRVGYVWIVGEEPGRKERVAFLCALLGMEGSFSR